jgi:hypothetical protein
MLHHEMSLALADRRIRALVTATKHVPRNLAEPSSRLRDHATQMRAALHVRGETGAGSTMTTASGAGPVGWRG